MQAIVTTILGSRWVPSLWHLHTIGECAFEGVEGSVDLSGCEGLEKIDKKAFRKAMGVNLRGCSQLHTIGDQAFYSTGEHIGFGGCKNLREIGKFAFFNTKLDVRLPNCAEIKTIGKYAFRMAKGVVDLSACKKLESIGAGAFQEAYFVNLMDCIALKTIDPGAFNRNAIILTEGASEKGIEWKKNPVQFLHTWVTGFINPTIRSFNKLNFNKIDPA